MQITRANKNDLVTILQLQKECYQSEAEIHDCRDIPPLKQDLDSVLEEFNLGLVLKAVIEDEIIGSVRGFSDKGTCYIGKLIVKKEHQNKGIGKKLMESFEISYNECSRYELFTGYKSQKNLFLYNKLGYTEFKREKIDDKLTLVYLEKVK